MKYFLFIFALVSSVYSFAVPIRPIKQDAKVGEAPGVATYSYNLWVTDVAIGTPPQHFTLAIDTWGSNLWVPDATCVNDYFILWELLPDCYGKNMFFSNQSSSYTAVPNKPFDGTDHLGKVTGNQGVDTITLGKIANQSTVIRSNFGQAVHIDNMIQNYTGVDGVLGLAGFYNWIEDGYNQGDFNADIVTLSLENQYETADNGTHGVIYYGNYDKLHCNFSYQVPSTSNTAYQFTVPQFNGSGVVSTTNRQAILDSTSEYIGVPSSIAKQVLASIGLDSNIKLPATVNCGLANSTLSFSFKTALGVETVSAVNLILYDQYQKTCQLAMVVAKPFATDSSSGHFELGIPFFRGRCVYFNRGQGAIGFGYPGKRVPGGKK